MLMSKKGKGNIPLKELIQISHFEFQSINRLIFSLPLKHFQRLT